MGARLPPRSSKVLDQLVGWSQPGGASLSLTGKPVCHTARVQGAGVLCPLMFLQLQGIPVLSEGEAVLAVLGWGS